MKSYLEKNETVKRDWFVIDAKDVVLGRLASHVAHVLRGKHKPTYTPNVDCGDFVIIINAKDVVLTGNKLKDKMYYNHSGYPGGLRVRSAQVMKDKYPIEMVERAVKGMLPKGRLGRSMYTKLFVYADEKHPHEAQKPVAKEVK